MKQFVKINEKDNVAVALKDLEIGERLAAGNGTVTLCDTIARGHKFALADIKKGEAAMKYGFPIGYAKVRINAGAHVHVHNLKTGLGDDLNYEYH
ncbi:MAG: UxaA family hydrolase, partial [Lachnospiraceae bacterium]